MRWTKSSYSSTGATCVQVRAPRPGVTEIGDTKNPHGPTLTVPNAAWDHFLDQVATGGTNFGRLHAEFLPDGGFILTDTNRPGVPALTYTRTEWDAFKLGVEAGELRSGNPVGTLVS
ncbi:DUF397 domain-containing protein [Nocardiopsis sp. NRRL B-16309]|uniref:DUF397 domain-containing protein n=1 Tax=Nocardiopsis sp. NRRL B-16309 TaxID=1519494 RepID=UPI0006ADCB9C|nr:DUF397 domain-containing protein [Nocardiopsis sp. NRRL B-16309]KOX17017.1 hypothetical protein ADL05_10560 [Nocardiopsis sp. NRRL B-16309]